ncbi:Antibiotic biosynthesis monooxygenase [Phytophthora palmivora]|uniref:Antibiotic biosynthesis monooxygenase n=1 Tax=Phytophthora palmivora TaxID=4796 RepID=A0A2P4YNN8_9STRA|nr:Antibiotic biosynthesis monooxygenase [Phytophthora palmivora]
MALTIIVNLYAKDGVEEQVRAKLAEGAKIFSNKEEGVQAWYPLQSTTDSRKWSIVERYDDESVRIISLSAVHTPFRVTDRVACLI